MENSSITIKLWDIITQPCPNFYCIYHVLSTQFSHTTCSTLWWRHNECDSVSNHQPHDCLLNSLFRRRSKKTSKLRVTGLCVGNSPGTGEFPAQMASNAENVSIWSRHHDKNHYRLPGGVDTSSFPYKSLHFHLYLKRSLADTNRFRIAWCHA